MADTTKDFAPLQSDYTFFLTHSTEADADLAAYREELSDFQPAGDLIRMLDFGCGPGTTTERLLSGLAWPRERLRLTVLDPVEDYRRQSAARLQAASSEPVAAWERLPDDAEHCFDLIFSNHVLYYVPDLPTTVAALTRALAPGGRFLTAMAGRENALIKIWLSAFERIGIPSPYHIADELEDALRAQGLKYSRRAVPFRLTFPDEPENRDKILRFLLGNHLELLPRSEARGFLDIYSGGNQVEIPVEHHHFHIPTP